MKIREATKEDIPRIVEMLANDELGKKRENYKLPIPRDYLLAYEQIASDANQALLVLEHDSTKVIGTLQLSFLRYLTYQGGLRAQIEQVRIHHAHRGKGLGKLLFQYAINRAKERGAHIIQLTTDKKRPEALKFYTNLGFKPSHEGMKLHL